MLNNKYFNWLYLFIKKNYLFISFSILIVIAVLSLYPENLQTFHKTNYLDKIFHFIAYFFLALPVSIIKPKYWLIYVFIFLLSGLLIEFLQTFNPEHQAELLDLMSNFAGVFSAIYFSKFIKK